MPGLNASLNIGLSGLQAAQAALNVVGHNIANINTPNYSRQRAILMNNDSQTFGSMQFGTGVNLNNIIGVRDRFLEMQITQATSRQSGADVRYAGVEGISPLFNEDGSEAALGTLVQRFFQSFQELSSRPEDGAVRTNVVGRAQSLINGLQSRYQLLTDQRNQADRNIGSLVTEVNTITAEIAKLNDRIATEPSEGSDSDARDQRQGLANQLAGLVGIQVFEDSMGQLQITLDSGAAVLVNGNTSSTMTATLDIAYGNLNRVDVVLGSGATIDVTQAVKEGALGAYLDIRDTVLPGYQTKLDELAAGISGQVNMQHRTGFDANGAAVATAGLPPGLWQDFFRASNANDASGLPTSVTAASNYLGMVNALSVNSDIVLDPRRIAAAGVAGAAGDNRNALALAKLQTATSTVDTNGDGVGDSGPFSTVIGSVVNTIGTDAQGFETRSTNAVNLLTALQTQRDRTSGVDLDEEATTMMSFQRSYQASARFISVINQLTDQLVNNFGK
jgi:flagellar hook-associated protein 1 FlgK